MMPDVQPGLFDLPVLAVAAVAVWVWLFAIVRAEARRDRR